MPLVVIDGRDAHGSELRGWGRYARSLLGGLAAVDLRGLQLRVVRAGGLGPELAFEQLKLPLLLLRRRAALVHSPNCFLPLRRPCPGVVTIHDLAFEQWPADFSPLTRTKYRRLVPLAARSAERVICPSRFTRDDLVARYGVEPAKVRVIPEAAALPLGDERWFDHGEASPAPYLLAVGDLRRKKNLAALVRAFADLWRDAGVPHRLVLAGLDTGEGARLRALAAQAPVEITGYLDDLRLDALMRGAELLVHPCPYEGFGLVALEAMARGTPVLAARAGALPETAGDAAAYFEPHDPTDLGRQLLALLTDDRARAELSRRGLARAAEFSWQRTAAETAAVYRELL
ncbi:MAG: glycosyltransferase family 4 protein [Solirubrobacterales bacterium]|nr:glycosyltransferase family 4 protein [Solirubrobacterales bacterium]